MDRPEPQLVTVAEAARILSMHPNQVYELCYTREIESVKIGKARRVVYEDLKRYVTELREKQWADGERTKGQSTSGQTEHG
jgi:excisionase family DNA binding protein